LGASEQPTGRLRAALGALGPVFADFGRYLSSRVDLLPRRDCLDLSATDEGDEARSPVDLAPLLLAQLGDAPERRFLAFDPVPRALTRWTQQHDAWLASGNPVVVTAVRPDAGELLDTDLPLLPLLAPWLDAPEEAVLAAMDDFSLTLRSRLDQTQQATSFIRLFDDAKAGGTLDAPRCYRDYCTAGILTVERVDGLTIPEALDNGGTQPRSARIDKQAIARQVASAWLRQAVTGHVVPFDFDLRDLRLRDGQLVMVSGALEPMTAAGGAQFLSYLVAAAADDPDRAWEWIVAAAEPRSAGQAQDELRRRLRQAVPFRDGEWSGDDRLAEQLLVQWRATREAGWTLLPHHLHLYRGIQAVSAATATLACQQDTLIEALQSERLRLGFAHAQHLFDSSGQTTLERLLPDMVDFPQKLDEILTLAAEGRLHVKVHMPDSGERREARNRTVSLVASLVTLVGLTFLVRHVAPAYGGDLERLAAVLVLVVGGWLLVAAARL
jgi:hypothetical protein